MTQNPPQLYLGDNYNSETGEPLAEIPSIKTLGEILPETESKIKEFFPDGGIYTGVIERVFYYRRVNKSVNRRNRGSYVDETVYDEAFSYFWVDLRDSDGNVHYFSVDAEDEIFKNLKKGDILTAVCFRGVTLNYKVEGVEAQNTVNHNLMVCAAVVYNGNKSISYINPQYIPKESSAAPLSLSAGLLAFIGGWIWEEILIGFACGAVAALVAYPIDLIRNKKQFERDEETFRIVKSIMKKLVRVSKRDLGYEFPARPKHRNDVICVKCDSRICATFTHCVYCGTNQASPDVEMARSPSASSPETAKVIEDYNDGPTNPSPHQEQILDEAISKDEASTAIPETQQPNISSKATPSANSVSAIEDALLAEFTLDYQQEYTHKAAIFFNEQGIVNATCIMAKVLDRHNDVDVSSRSNVQNGTYFVDIYRNYSDGSSRYDRTELRGSITTTNTRTSTMNSLFVLQLEEGKVIHTQLPNDMAADLDVGDWFVLAESTVDLDQQIINREFAINLTKDKEYPCSNFEKYKGPTGFKAWLSMFFLVAVLNLINLKDITYWVEGKLRNTGLSKFASEYGIDSFFPIIIYMIISVFVLFRTISLRKENRRNRQKVMAPLKELIGSLQAKSQEVKATIKQIS